MRTIDVILDSLEHNPNVWYGECPTVDAAVEGLMAFDTPTLAGEYHPCRQAAIRQRYEQSGAASDYAALRRDWREGLHPPK